MPLYQWSDRNESLNSLRLTIEKSTHGLIRELSLELSDDDCALVRGVSRSFYGVQLAIHATQRFGAECCLHPETRLLIRVDGAMLELIVLRRSDQQLQTSLSTRVAGRRPQLTGAACS